MTKMTMKVTEMTCGHCKAAIEKEVAKVEGVKTVSADPASKDVVIEFDAPADWDKIKKVLEENEFPPTEEQTI
eukprot:CAMPEP_0184329998 /NCGR_PEP_ID=MMETSP1049-20130417/144448_1 /TAXON_ID=77928 /ORGANISM="Proteomonas sulcata, Strain CCMP704" /LENGTH=72 /DNA_ID=CAMNT_0026652401 /DNA_START=497 /DNA_END=715 /DNA_ORIENTATION=+